jgi:hypothetical protein
MVGVTVRDSVGVVSSQQLTSELQVSPWQAGRVLPTLSEFVKALGSLASLEASPQSPRRLSVSGLEVEEGEEVYRLLHEWSLDLRRDLDSLQRQRLMSDSESVARGEV